VSIPYLKRFFTGVVEKRARVVTTNLGRDFLGESGVAKGQENESTGKKIKAVTLVML
jgi:hypothetical protein